ncbi:MAG TPA: hypothetical protein VIM56_04990, partial [Rhizomicrobium sp.]
LGRAGSGGSRRDGVVRRRRGGHALTGITPQKDKSPERNLRAFYWRVVIFCDDFLQSSGLSL